MPDQPFLFFPDNTVLNNFAIITRRQLKGFYVSDDRDAAREAKSEGVKVVTTWDILRLLVRVDRITVDQFHSHAQMLVQANRGYPPGWSDKSAVERRLGATA